MRKVRVSNIQGDAKTTNPRPGPKDSPKNRAKSSTAGSVSTPNAYFGWFYHLSTPWILWRLINNTPKEEDGETEHVRTRLPRVDSGVGLHLLGQDVSRQRHSTGAAAADPITLTIHFEDGTTIKKLDYHAFAKWEHISALLDQLIKDGIVINALRDANEDMPISSGDWDARIQPGSLIEAWCFSDVREDDWEGDSSGNESEDDMEGDKVEDGYRMSRKGSRTDARNEHTWWFTRWRQRVEKTMPGEKEALDEPSWFMIVVWCTSVVGIVIIVSVLSL